jgi:preprotein translocase subunit SecD
MNYAGLLGNRRIQIVILVALVSLAAVLLRDLNPSTLDVNLGIEFVGGVRIPVMLEHSIDAVAMDQMVETVKTRINKYGLSQAVVRPVGDSEILVEIPQADDSVIKSVETLLKDQGKFEAVIDGKLALAGSDILANAVGGASNEGVTSTAGGGVGWYIGFAASRPGAERFAAAATGKAYYPVYMFLDRPSNASILFDNAWLNNTSDSARIMGAMQKAVAKQGDDLEILSPSDFSNNTPASLATKTVFVADKDLATDHPDIYRKLQQLGFNETPSTSGKRLILFERADMIPLTYVSEQSEMIVNDWRAIGLLSGPTLSPGLANGFVSQFYQVNGGARGNTPDEQKKNAIAEIKHLKTVISGGRLPVSTFIGSSYTVAPSLGKQFLNYSAIGVLLSVAIVAGLIVLRYRKVLLAVPIVIINVIEMVITLAIVGTFGTLDLAAMAGIITLIGTGVDDQIIITDEMLRKKHAGEEVHEKNEEEVQRNIKARIGRAFEIVVTVASVAIATMLPLFLSGIVEIQGFALSYIIGVLVGVLITRPAYGVMVGEMFGREVS